MKGSETKLIKYMEGADKRFVIPVYQRNYDWKIENCKQLYDDLVKVVRNNRKNHFFGSIVSTYNPDGDNEEYQIIDGQQRLTTVSLLLLAMYNLIRQGKVLPADNRLSDRIYEDYLVDKYQPEETRIKLKPIKNDRKAFGKLFDEETEHIGGSNLTTNYNYFYDRIQKEEITIDELFQAIRSLEIISIRLDSDDNPQLIFESLNSTGLDLSEGDKIRNYILMGQPSKQQEVYYEKYWNKIEENTNYQVDLFVRDYLSVKQQATPSLNKIYFTFKNYVEDERVEIEGLLIDLLNYAKLYRVLLTAQVPDKRLASCIYRLNRLETTVTRPFFLEVLRLQTEGTISMDDVVEIFLTTENYLFRRTICELPTNQLNKIFLLLHKEVIRYDGTAENYLEKLKYALLSKKERARFPEDAEFADAFGVKQIYSMNAKNKMYILERFENFGTIEDKDVYRHFDDGDYSIEHIMPQHLTPAWAEALGSDYERIHETWLHRMANLTLTAYNSKYSNNSFLEKRDMANGFKDSGIRMNQWIGSQSQWTETELELRNDYVQQRALEIWASPVTSFRPIEKQLDSYTLDDEIDLTGRKIARFAYLTMEQPVKNWAEMFESVVRILHSEDKSVLNNLAYETDQSVDLATYVSHRKQDLRGYIEIDRGIYVERNTSTWMKLSILKRLFGLYHLDPTNLVFYLRDDDGTEEDEQIAGTRHEVRKKFWTYALDLIKEANAESGAFSNCNPVKENWVNGYFGIQGFNLCCVGNFDSARVEVYFGKADNDENKKAYDLVAGHKTEIERALGEELIWDRGDDKKSSKIYYMIDGVGIDNETDWPVIAKFHAKWTVKLYEAIVVPYLKPVYLEAPAPASSETKTSSNNTIEIKKIGITDLDTDAIVNAANDGLWAGSGVCGAIFRAAGRDKLQAACNEIGHCDTGSAVITPGFDLKAKYIIHAVGPVWNGGDHNEPQQLYGAYRKSLELALENGCHSVGFPLISAGIFGYPKDKAWRKAIQACTDFFEKHPEADLKVIFAVLDDDILTIGKNTVDEIAVNYKA